jgi:hypothetical protein
VALDRLGFRPGDPEVTVPHVHHYRAEHDAAARSVLGALEWRHSDLRPEDEQ